MRSGIGCNGGGPAMSEPIRLTPPSYEYEFHPLAGMFTLIDGEDFDQLAEDIGARGIICPIILFEGKILDGRNRYHATDRHRSDGLSAGERHEAASDRRGLQGSRPYVRSSELRPRTPAVSRRGHWF
jgi:hypothetical protein